MLRGDLGQPPGGWPKALQKKALKGEKPITARPGSLLADADLTAERADAEKRFGRRIDDDEFASYLMYPKVFGDFVGADRKYGPVSVLPTPIYFYGMQVGDETSFGIEKGKSLVVRLQAIGDTDEEGQVRVFFELNGQPRMVRVPNRAADRVAAGAAQGRGGQRRACRRADAGRGLHVAIKPGQQVKTGDFLLPWRR